MEGWKGGYRGEEGWKRGYGERRDGNEGMERRRGIESMKGRREGKEGMEEVWKRGYVGGIESKGLRKEGWKGRYGEYEW